ASSVLRGQAVKVLLASSVLRGQAVKALLASVALREDPDPALPLRESRLLLLGKGSAARRAPPLKGKGLNLLLESREEPLNLQGRRLRLPGELLLGALEGEDAGKNNSGSCRG
ncbi:MAG: hypothetical protein K6T17_08910, partial [Fimbriimonadales bacterium]|nr:hypothetical protein [Fimbriimonadales bacterium]